MDDQTLGGCPCALAHCRPDACLATSLALPSRCQWAVPWQCKCSSSRHTQACGPRRSEAWNAGPCTPPLLCGRQMWHVESEYITAGLWKQLKVQALSHLLCSLLTPTLRQNFSSFNIPMSRQEISLIAASDWQVCSVAWKATFWHPRCCCWSSDHQDPHGPSREEGLIPRSILNLPQPLIPCLPNKNTTGKELARLVQ